MDGYVLERGQQGILQIKGPTVMKGYYKRPDLTEKVMTVDGWLDTGDLAVFTIHNELQIKGRIKDTIVLRGGENLEPLPIEMKMQESRFIQTAVVLGQDQRYLAALVVPEQAEVEAFCKESNLPYKKYSDMVKSAEVLHLIETEVATRVNSKNGFKMYERINKIALLEKPFEVGVELSAKQEIMRFRINEIYSGEIKKLFKA
jgi:long-chain acyl-CoA synthetase